MATIYTQPYTYTGPLSSVTLRVDGQDLDVLLNPRKSPVLLPPKHEFTQTLLAQKRLVRVPTAQASDDAAANAPATADETATEAAKSRRGKVVSS